MINQNVKNRKKRILFLPAKLTLVCLFMLAFKAQCQLSFQTVYQIKNNTGLAVCVDFTVSCNEGKSINWAKLVSIPANTTYTVPAPYLNSARSYPDCDITVQISGLFGGEAVSFSHQTSSYNQDMGLFNTSVKGFPLGKIIWTPSITTIW